MFKKAGYSGLVINQNGVYCIDSHGKRSNMAPTSIYRAKTTLIRQTIRPYQSLRVNEKCHSNLRLQQWVRKGRQVGDCHTTERWQPKIHSLSAQTSFSLDNKVHWHPVLLYPRSSSLQEDQALIYSNGRNDCRKVYESPNLPLFSRICWRNEDDLGYEKLAQR